MTSARISPVWGTFLLTITIFSLSLPAYAKYSGGTGEPDDPYQIATAEDLMLLGESPEDYDKHFILTADIDLDPNLPGGRVFERAVIAPKWPYSDFAGVFNGNGHIISHLTVKGVENPKDNENLGLFGNLTPLAQVKDLGLLDISVTVSNRSGYTLYMGGLVARNEGLVTRCHSCGLVSGSGACVAGGLVGVNRANVTQCSSIASVNSGDREAGGLVGTNSGVVTHCYSTGTVSGHGPVGGLVGYNFDYGSITKCYSSSSVSGTYSVGGLVGYGNPERIKHSVWDMEASGLAGSDGGVGLTKVEMMDPYMLGLNGFANDPNWVLNAGRDYPRLAWEGTPGSMILDADVDWLEGLGTADNPYRIDTADQMILLGKASILWDKHFLLAADIPMDPNLPGRSVFGKALIPLFSGVFDGNGHVIQHLTIRGERYLGLFGKLASSAEVKNLGVADVNIIGTDSTVGALVGSNAGSITSSHSNGVVSGQGSVGCLVGRNDGTISDCYSHGSVSGGGLVGGLVGNNAGGDVIQCYSSGMVSADTGGCIGGLVGLNVGKVTDCYSRSGVTASTFYVGGLVGCNINSVIRCYSTGMVRDTEDGIGGLVGSNDYNRPPRLAYGRAANACFWDTETSGQATSDGGVGKTTADMQTARTFLDAGWDFVGETANGTEDIWKIAEGVGYPRLSWEKYSGGTGEPNDPYRIATAADLIALGETPEDYDKHFILTADIDLDPNLPGGKVFDRALIAPDTDPNTEWGFDGTAFTGVFDGNGQTISHLTINGNDYLGLFGQLSYSGEIRNLGVAHVNIAGSDDIGGIVGENRGGALTNCHSSGSVSGHYIVGGLVGACVVGCQSRHSIVGSYSSASVSGTYTVGGLVGWNTGRIRSSYSVGGVSGTHYVGGLVGSSESGTRFCGGSADSSFWDTETSGQTTSAGGTGKTTAEMQTASTFLGWGGAPSFWTIDEGIDYPRLAWEGKPGMPLPALTDLIAGSGTQEDPYLIHTSDDLNTIGVFLFECDKHFKLMADIDLSGITYSQAVIPDFAGIFDGNDHTVSHLTIAGYGGLGLFGVLKEGAEVRNVGVMDVNISGTGDSLGGLVGSNGGVVARCYSTGTVSGRDYVGGLVGDNNGIVIGCHNDGLVSGDAWLGGLVGRNDGVIAQCYSTGVVSGRRHSVIGGLVGWNDEGSIACSYSSGSVSGTGANVGGLVGRNTSLFGKEGIVSDSFWDIETSGQTRSAGGIGNSTAEMQTAGTFLEAGWDFVGETANGTEDIWWILEGQDYPRLWWESTEQ